MSFIYTTRAMFILLATLFGIVACYFNPGLKGSIWVWGASGFALSSFIVLVESMVREAYPKTLVMGVGGLLVGMVTASMTSALIPSPNLIGDANYATTVIALHLVMGYIGAVVALRYVERVDLSSDRLITAEEPRLRGSKILDSSVLIDGRFLDMVNAGFCDGLHIIPKFVLDELQNIADSPDASRRQRGRRGLDIVRALRETNLQLEITERDYPHIQSVDAKLIQLAKDFQARILTNDFNLNKVAEIQNIMVLNINDLANALKPIILPGEYLTVTLLKPGKEHGQGVGYLDDGTMVVVEDGYHHLNEEVNVMVTSILQTAAGRMIFGRVPTEQILEPVRRPTGNSKPNNQKILDLGTQQT